MSKIALTPNASGTGTLTVAAPNTNTDRTITLPDATGTMNISGLANEVPAGSVGSPSIYSTGDSNTGIFFPAADTIAFSEGGAEAMRIDSSGNVGIGTNNPQRRLDVTSSSSSVARFFGNNANNYIELSDNNAAAVATIGSIGGGNMYTYSAGYNAMYAGGSERMRIDSSGNVGIGTSSPSYRVDVASADTTAGTGYAVRIRANATAAAGAIQFTDSTAATQNGIIAVDTSSNMKFTTSLTERMRIDSSGNVGIGTSSPTGAGTTLATQGAYSSIVAGSTSNASFVSFYSGQTADPNPSILYNNSLRIGSATSPNTSGYAERMRIDASGNVMVGTSSVSNGAKFTVAGTVSASLNGRIYSLGTYNNTTSSGANMHIALDGHIFRSTSSLKYKTNVQDATHGLAEVMTLRPVTYKGKNDGALVFGGLIAEEVHEAGLTEFVQYAEDGSPDALAYGNMVSLCIKAIQELTARIAALEAK